MKALLPLLCLCLCLFALSTSAPSYTTSSSSPGFQAVSKFDASQLSSVNWYEQIYFTNTEDELNGCPRDVFTSTSNGKIIYQYGQYTPGINGDFQSLTLTIKQTGNTGKFTIYNGKSGEYFYILDFDPNYQWIVYGIDQQGSTGDAITVITKTSSQNSQTLAAIQRGIDLAAQYGFDSHHLELQSTTCNYNNIFSKLKTLRKGL
jgi:hypothetical protein